MKEFVNVALVGLGQIGNYFYNEINTKKKENLRSIRIYSTKIQ